ncbi:hemerythrin domain-containing protein [Aegicerativicinus sediminis]|uniref:hemerythrin domain-containing protein n=1 Tax=Aegicerativicinus sediminis TaxID=2893202 RepID=UPI001E5F8ADB|nr:hemerythrin domain-containing protein [Aegicerativicinus sediminis]
MNIFEAIRKDHDIQRDLLAQLIETSGDSKNRDVIYSKIKSQLLIHADAEERYFYKPLISSDMMQDHARHGIAEHHEIEELIEQLDSTEYSASNWLVIAKKLKEKVEHHLEDEEHVFFQLAGKVFTEKQKTDLAEPYRKHMASHE